MSNNARTLQNADNLYKDPMFWPHPPHTLLYN